MQITKTVTPSFFQANNGSVYSGVVDGKATKINHRNREPMVLMTEADFLKLAKKVQG